MTDQEHTNEQVDKDISDNLTVDEEDEGALQDQFILIRGKYKYGGRNKTYGIFELIGQQGNSKFDYVDLGSSTNNDVYNLFLDVNDQNFLEMLKQLVSIDNTQDRNISQDLRRDLVVAEVVELVTTDNQDQVKELIKEKIEDEMQEEIELEFNCQFVSQADLMTIYPERFGDNEVESSSGELSLEDSSSSDNLDTEEGLSDGLNIDLKLNCSPVISAISGKLITSFNVDDEILVRITDNRELTGELKNRIKISNGLGVGTIKKIEYKEELDRYKVLVQLGEKIFGQLVIGPKLMLSYPESKTNLDTDSVDEADLDLDSENNDTAVIFTIIGLFLVIIILLLLYL